MRLILLTIQIKGRAPSWEGGRRACLLTPGLNYVQGGRRRERSAKIIDGMDKTTRKKECKNRAMRLFTWEGEGERERAKIIDGMDKTKRNKECKNRAMRLLTRGGERERESAKII